MFSYEENSSPEIHRLNQCLINNFRFAYAYLLPSHLRFVPIYFRVSNPIALRIKSDTNIIEVPQT